MAETEDLIRAIVAEAGPVRRLASPFLRATAWLCSAVIVVTAVTLVFGFRDNLAAKLGDPVFALELVAVALTGVAASVAAFCLSLPDRSRLWLLLPVPPLLAWLSTIGYGCLTSWIPLGPGGPAAGISPRCFATAVLISVPLAAILLRMLRHAAPTRPVETAVAGALAIAALTTGGLRLFHDLDPTIVVLGWAVGTTLLFTMLGGLFGRRLFSWVWRRQLSDAPHRAARSRHLTSL
jgi:hypothetical protein